MRLKQALKKYIHRLPENILLSYEDSDDFIYINENDDDLQKWRIQMPEPPDWDKINGFGRHAMEQVFEPEKIPKKLIALEEKVESLVEATRNKKDSEPAIQKRKYEKKWEELKRLRTEYADEIEWIKEQWYYFNYGKWFFIKGKPIHIPKWQWFYLNYFKMERIGLPDFRIRDLKWFYAQEYAYTTTETVDYKEYNDEYGKLIKEHILLDDGTLKMKDIGIRTCYGTNNLKGRRVGETSKSTCIGYCILISDFDTNAGIQGNSDNTASEIYKDKLLYAFDRMPFFFTPIMKDYFTTYGIHCDTKFSNDGLNSHYVFATTAKKEFFDQKRLDFLHVDELGKTKLEDIVTRHGVIKRCLSEGDIIKGIMINTSTAEDMEAESGMKFEELTMDSMFEQRMSNGQTVSGVINVYFPHYESMAGWIDRYGYPIIHEPKEYQIQDMKRVDRNKDGRIMGAKEFLEKNEQDLKDMGNLEKLAEEQRRNPSSFRKCFALAIQGTQFNTQILQERIYELKFDYRPRIGRFEWQGEPIHSRVVFVDDPKGKWHVSYLPQDNETNLKGYDGLTYYPRFDSGFIVSSDSYRFDKTDSRRESKGGIAVYQMYDERIDGGKPDTEAITERFVADYLGKEQKRGDFAMEVLKAAIFYNGLVYPEANLGIEQEHFDIVNHLGYMLYDVNPETKKKSNNAGFHSVGGIKNKIFSHIDSWINVHAKKCKHVRILEDYLNIRDPKFMKDFDLFVASGGCLLGRTSRYTKFMKTFSTNSTLDVTKFWKR